MPGRKRGWKAGMVIFLGVFLFAGCSREKDPAEQQVLEITITPEPTPTPEPAQLDPEAVETTGSLTMVNGYLVEDMGVTRDGTAPAVEEDVTVTPEPDATVTPEEEEK